MPKYSLVNPIIIGNLNTTVVSDNDAVAAKELYVRLSKYFNKPQNNLIFTIQRVSSKDNDNNKDQQKFYSFKVKEVEKKNELVYTISRYTGKVNKDKLSNSISRVFNKIKAEDDLLSSESENDNKPQNGGAKSDNKYSSKLEDSDSFNKLLEELDEDEEEFEFKNKKKYKNELVLPYFAIPGLIDPISYYWYSNIYYDLPKMIVPSFIPTISPRIVIDLNLP